ncbi:MAG TPA: hypothetical protein VGA66_00470, partial [Mycobacterium sp.]
MVEIERLGVTPDGRPVTEVSKYIKAREGHPLAIPLEGHEGHWQLASVNNGLADVAAREVTRVEFNAATSAWQAKAAAVAREAQAKREAVAVSSAERKQRVRVDLLGLGLSQETVDALA